MNLLVKDVYLNMLDRNYKHWFGMRSPILARISLNTLIKNELQC